MQMSTIHDSDLNPGEPAGQPQAPLISIITVNFNNQAGLMRTLSSVSEQTFADFEQIVVDGGSSDGSAKVLQNKSLTIARWVSEPDRGIYHAMNKGIRMARGRYLMFLNSGDHLLDSNSLEVAASVIDDKDIYYFSLEMRPLPGKGDIRIKSYPGKLTFSFFFRDTLPHQSSFLKADLFERFGLYDENLRMGSDWKHFLLWVCRHNCSYSYDPRVMGVFYEDGLSSSSEAPSIHLAEHKEVLEAEFPAFVEDLSFMSQGRELSMKLDTLRSSRIIRLAQRVCLMWRF